MAAVRNSPRVGAVLTFAGAWVALACCGWSPETAPVVAGIVATLIRGNG